MVRKTIFIFIFFVFSGLRLFSQNHFIDSICVKYKIPGLTYAVFGADTIFEAGTYGLRDINNDTSYVKISTRFHIGSNTKAVTAILAAMMVESGSIGWNTGFFDVFPELKEIANENYLHITLRDLLCHRANIPPHREVNSNYDIYKLPGEPKEQRYILCKTILKEQPVYPDSASSYVYSNAGFMMAAAMLEKISGKPWEEMINELNNKTGAEFQIGFPNRDNPFEAWGHILNNDTIISLPPDFDYRVAASMRPAGDLNVDLPSYIKFIQQIISGYKGNDNCIKSETWRYLLSAIPEYSFGWANKTINGKNYNYHSGSAGTFGCFVKIDRDNGIASIVMENYSDGGSLNAIQIIADYLLNEYRM